MTFQIGFVLFLLILMTISLIFEITRPELIVFFAMSVFILAGILSPVDALRGFSNQGVITIALLFIVAGAVQQSGVLNAGFRKIIGTSQNPRKNIIRLMLPVSILSAFMNNTPIVIMLMSEIRQWCRKNKLPASKFLIPLSFASVFGGSLTLIGTSTNLAVQGMLIDRGLPGMSMFDIAIIGIPTTIIGIMYMALVGYRLLPHNKDIEETFADASREYLVSAKVGHGSSIVGKSIEEVGLRNLSGLYLIEIIRGDEHIAPVSSYEKINGDDRLIFTGVPSTIIEVQKINGLSIEADTKFDLDDLKNGNAQLVEAVVSANSSLLNKSVKQNSFRSRYDASVVAVQRHHERIDKKIGDIILKPGDTILLLTGREFEKRAGANHDFYLISESKEHRLIDPRKSKMILGILLLVIILSGFQVLSMFKAALLGVMILFVTKAMTVQESKNYIQLNILLLIASSFGIGYAISSTGTADYLVNLFLKLAGNGLNKIVIVLLVYIITNILTEFITNSAAAVIMFPIVISLSHQTGMEVIPLMLTLMIAASSSFATPIGYQTNLMVYGPGRYKFTDYMKVGIPLSVLFMITTVTVVYLIWLT